MELVRQSPLALSFEKAIQPSEFLLQIRKAAESEILAETVEQGNAALGLAAVGARVVLDKGAVQVVFKNGIPAGAKLMKSAGKHLPKLVDGKTGRILEVGRVASKARSIASLAANAALIVVEAAHMISGHDNAKRLKSIERGVERLIVAYESELKARLEAIYRYAKELHHGPGPLTPEDKRQLHEQCRDLFELRARWRDDFRHRIRKVEPAKDANWWERLFGRRDEVERRNREAKGNETLEALEIVQMMQFSLMLQMTLAGSSDRIDAFLHATLPDECRQWRELAEFGRQRAQEITGGRDEPNFLEFLGQLDGVADYWEVLNREKKPRRLTKPRARKAASRVAD